MMKKQEKWETYLEPMEDFFLANNINKDHQVSTLLSLMGGKTNKLLRGLLTHQTNQLPVGRGGWVVYLDASYPTASIHGHFVLSPVLLATRCQDGGPSNLTIEIYDLTEK